MAFKKEIGPISAAFLALGGILGSAVPFLPAIVFAYGGPMGILSWLIGFVIMSLLGLVFAELGSTYPETGGVVRYLHFSHGAFASFFNAWGTFIGYFMAVISETVAVVEYLAFFYPSLFHNGSLTPLGEIVTILIILILFLVQYYGVKLVSMTNDIMTWIKVIGLVAFIIITPLLVFHSSNFTPPSGIAPYGLSGVLTATSITVYAYAGFRQPIDYGEEMKNPSKDIPRAVIYSILISLGIYFLLSVVFLGALNWSAIGTKPYNWSYISSLSAPIPQEFTSNILILGIYFFIIAIIATISSTLVYFGSAARVLYANAKNGYMPKVFLRLNRSGVPYVALIVSLLIGIFYLFAFPQFLSEASIFSVASVISYAPASVSLLVLRELDNRKRVFKLKYAKIIAPIAFSLGGLLIYWATYPTTLYTISSTLVGIPIYIYYEIRNKSKFRNIILTELKRGWWYVAWLISILLVSYLGSFGGINLIPSPYDMITVFLISLLFFYLGYVYGKYGFVKE
ncbi:APC family permease [Sulfurisphaera javensis]|uniref:APC family permease n=1 Tax=Sulfurisphaera javensis TaxID=2049879 RepID=A0AAT9GSM6_9CREN